MSVTPPFPIIPYAEMMVEPARGMRDTFVFAERCQGAVAVGGEFNRDTRAAWELFGRLGRPRIDLAGPAVPTLLTYETFAETRQRDAGSPDY